MLQNHITVRYAANGKCILDYQQQGLIAAVNIENKPQLYISHTVVIPGRTLAIISVYNDLYPKQSGSLYEICPNNMFVDKHPNLYVIPMIHNMDVHRNEFLPFVIINLASEDISLSKGETMGYMNIQPLEISEILTETSIEPTSIICEINEKKDPEKQKEALEEEVEKKFITSPTNIDVHRKVELQDTDVSEEHKQAFRDLCTKFIDIFSTDSGDIRKTPYWKLKLIQAIVHQSPKNLIPFL